MNQENKPSTPVAQPSNQRQPASLTLTEYYLNQAGNLIMEGSLLRVIMRHELMLVPLGPIITNILPCVSINLVWSSKNSNVQFDRLISDAKVFLEFKCALALHLPQIYDFLERSHAQVTVRKSNSAEEHVWMFDVNPSVT